MNDITTNEAANTPGVARYTLWQLVRYMLGLGTWGFGGPVALVGYMYRDLVGVWTKADSVTAFDDFVFGAARCAPLNQEMHDEMDHPRIGAVPVLGEAVGARLATAKGTRTTTSG